LLTAASEHRPQVNKIREVPGYESIIVTHTDAPELFVWSLERQPDRAQDRVRHFRPNHVSGRAYEFGI